MRTISLTFFLVMGGSAGANDAQVALKKYKSSQLLLKKKKYKAALKLLREADRLAPPNGYYLARMGDVYLWHSGEYRLAIEKYQASLAKGGDRVGKMASIGLAYFKLGDQAEAVQFLRKAIDTAAPKSGSPSLANAYGWLTFVHSETGSFRQALETSSAAYAEFPGTDHWYLAQATASAAIMLGHEYFADGEFEKAAAHYKKAEWALVKNKSLAPRIKAERFQMYRAALKLRKNLGKVVAKHTYKFLVIQINRVDVTHKAFKAQNKLSLRQIDRSKMFQELMARYVEALSRARLTVTFDHAEIDGPISEVAVSRYSDVDHGSEVRTPILESIPGIGELLFENINKYDGFLFLWNGEGVATNAGGGPLHYPLVPYQLYSQPRGYISFPANWDSADAVFGLIHEFFHITEAAYKISPTHGFGKRARRNFPGWKGKGQFDYYRWHFATTIRDIAPLVARKHDATTASLLEQNRDNVKAVSLGKRKQARELATRGLSLWYHKKKKKKAIALYRKALKLNASEPTALKELGVFYLKEKNPKGVKYFERLVLMKPEVWSLNHLAYHLQWQLNKPGRAVEVHERALKLASTHKESAPIYLNLGRAYLALNQDGKALKAFKSGAGAGVPQGTHAVESLFWQGYTLRERLGRRAEGKKLIRRAVKLGYDNDFSRRFLK